MRSNKKAVDRETHQAAKGLKAKRDRKGGKTGGAERKGEEIQNEAQSSHRETD